MEGPNVKLPLISWLFIMPFNFLTYVHIINSGLNKSNSPPWLFFSFFKFYKWYQMAQNITYNKNSSDNLTKPFIIYKMYDCQCMILKETNIFVSVIIYSIISSLMNGSRKIPTEKIPTQLPPGKSPPPQKIPTWNFPTHFINCLFSPCLHLILRP